VRGEGEFLLISFFVWVDLLVLEMFCYGFYLAIS
jgi:hypothetical protein